MVGGVDVLGQELGGAVEEENCGQWTRANLLQLVGLYTDESPGLKVDPVVVLVLSLGFIFSVVALHGMYTMF